MRVLSTILIALVVGFAALYASLYRLDVLPRLALAPGWVLESDQGTRLTSEDVRGEIVVYSFSYGGNESPERRPEPVLSDLQRELSLEEPSIPVRILTISIDGDRDSVAVLQTMARRAGADPVRWQFARAEPAVVQNAVRRGFDVYFERQEDGSYRFDPVFVVVDGTGIIRSRYRFGVPDRASLMADIRSLTREAEAATGTARLAYEAAHLFSCYSRSSL